jgi:hypothetical protein
LILLKYYFYKNNSNNNFFQLKRGPATNPNDEYYPIVVSDESGSQNLYTNNSKLNYDISNNILYVDNLLGNLNTKSKLVNNLIKENIDNNLLIQASTNVTTSIPRGNVGNVLISNGINNPPSWKGLYDNVPGFDSILFRTINRTYYSSYYNIGFSSTEINRTITFSDSIIYDLHVKNLTINNGVVLNTSGYRIYVSEKLTINGTIESLSDGVSNFTTLGLGMLYNNDNNNGISTNFGGGIGGNGAGSTLVSGLGGNIIYPSNKEGGEKLFYQYPNFLTMGYYDINNNFIYYNGGASGGGGYNVGNLSGGAGGKGGGIVYICAKTIEFGPNGKIKAIGGNGWSGQTDSNGNIITGGGGGGGGGLIVIITNTKGLSPTDNSKFNVSGGNPGLGGNAQKGGDGKVIIFDNL